MLCQSLTHSQSSYSGEIQTVQVTQPTWWDVSGTHILLRRVSALLDKQLSTEVACTMFVSQFYLLHSALLLGYKNGYKSVLFLMRLFFSSFILGHVETDIMILDYMFRLIKTILKSGTNYYLSLFRYVHLNNERHLLDLSCLSVCLSAHIRVASPAPIFVKFGIGNF